MYTFPKYLPKGTFFNAKGDTTSVQDYHGKVIVLNFFKITCKKCVKELPSLNELAKAHPEIVVLTISEGLEGVQFPISCGLACLSGKKDEIRFYQEFESGKSYKIVIPVKEMKGLDAASLKSVQSIQFVFYEKRLPDTSVYKFQFNNLRLTTGTASAIQVEEKE